jgi:hypothetical protein
MLIAAMLVAPVVSVISMPTVSASPAVAATFEPDVKLTKANVSITVTVTITNTGDESIENIRILPAATGNPGTLENLAPVVILPKDNVIRTGVDNIVTIPAGTVVKLTGTVVVPAGENVQIPAGGYVARDNYYESGGSYELQLNENLLATITNENINVVTGDKGTLDNLSLSLTDENVSKAEDFKVVIDNATVRLVEDTWAIRTDVENVYLLVSDTTVEIDNLVVSAQIAADNTFKNENIISVAVDDTVDIDPSLVDNVGRIFIATHNADASPYDISKGENIIVVTGTDINLLPGTRLVVATGTVIIELEENQRVVRGGRENVIAEIAVENRPIGWMQYEGTVGGVEYVEWVAIGGATSENALAPGESENFPFAVSIPAQDGTYYFDAYLDGSYKEKVFSIEVDGTKPTITVEVSPDWVKDNVEVTITITVSEEVSIDNVFVAENNGENVALTLSTTDNKVFTATYITGDNENRDGYATIYVVGVRDAVGNENEAVKDDLLFIDRRAPGPIDLDVLSGWPEEVENKASFTISAGSGSFVAENDNLVWVPSDEALAIRDGLQLEFLVDGQSVGIGDIDPYGGLSTFTLSLSEGKHEVGVRLIDRAGNVGEISAENIVVDTSAPSVSISVTTLGGEAVTDGGYVKENRVKIQVSISDAVLGVENRYDTSWVNDGIADNLVDNENFDLGWAVIFTWTDNEGPVPVDNLLDPETAPVIENEDNVRQNVFLTYTFENITPELPAGTYTIRVIAGDSMNTAYGKGPHKVEKTFTFKIDVEPPAAPSLATTTYQQTTLDAPQRGRKKTFSLSGTAEAGAIITAYANLYDPKTGSLLQSNVVLGSTTAGQDGRWSMSVNIGQYQGKVVEIRLEAKDAAGNVSTERTLYGYFLYDESPPTVTIDAQYKNITTDQSSIVITGSVEFDDWEHYTEIAVTASLATASIVTTYDEATGKILFTVSVPLSEGQTVIGVTAVDPVGNTGSDYATITRTVTPWATYAIVIVIIALILAAIGIFRRA